jgi:hypothetical protein
LSLLVVMSDSHLPSNRPGVRSPTQLELRFLDHVAEIREVGAEESGHVAFLSRMTVQANLPYRDPGRSFYERRNGRMVLTLQAPPTIGLPYGRYPRLLLAWIGQEAVRTRSRELRLGDSLTGFMRELGIQSSGGRHGPWRRFRDQAQRLFATTVSCRWTGSTSGTTAQLEMGHRIASRSLVWWARHDEPGLPAAESGPQPGSSGLTDGGWLVLTEEYFEELLRHPVPVDSRVLRALHAPRARDSYAWLTWRVHGLRHPVEIPWKELALQFGTRTKRLRNFRQQFIRALTRVRLVYPDARVVASPKSLRVLPTRTHVRRRRS